MLQCTFCSHNFFGSEFMLSTWIRTNRWILAISIKESHQTLNRSLSLYAFKDSGTNRSVSPHINFARFAKLLCKLCTDYILISLFVCTKHVWSYASCLSSTLNWGIQMPWTSVSYIWKLYQYLILVTCGFYKNPSFKYCSFQW